jgi:transcriptional regulator with XRE-family HTH domain
MTEKIEIETAHKDRKVSPASVSSKARGRPVADLVERFERAGAKFKDLSSAALRAGDLIRTMRKAAGISQAELADKMGVTQSRISEIEAGMGSQGPTWNVMERAAAACGKRFNPVKIESVDVQRSPFPEANIIETEKFYTIIAELPHAVEPHTVKKLWEVRRYYKGKYGGVRYYKGKPGRIAKSLMRGFFLKYGRIAKSSRRGIVQSDKIEATLNDGVLEVKLPKFSSR